MLGKNGVKIGGNEYKPGCEPIPLASQTLVQIGEEGLSFWFLLPKPPRDVATGRKRKAG